MLTAVLSLDEARSRSRRALEMGRLQEESDQALIARAKQDPDGFGVLYERYVGRIYSYIYYRTGNHHDAEDLTAQTFHRAFQHVPHYVDRGLPFSAWLYRIAHNLVANWYRDRGRRQIVSIDDIVLASRGRDDPVALAEEGERHVVLLGAVQQLPPERQQLLILKFVDHLSNAEIARTMGRTEGAIKSLYHRTLIALREVLSGTDVWESEWADGAEPTGPSAEESS